MANQPPLRSENIDIVLPGVQERRFESPVGLGDEGIERARAIAAEHEEGKRADVLRFSPDNNDLGTLSGFIAATYPGRQVEMAYVLRPGEAAGSFEREQVVVGVYPEAKGETDVACVPFALEELATLPEKRHIVSSTKYVAPFAAPQASYHDLSALEAASQSGEALFRSIGVVSDKEKDECYLVNVRYLPGAAVGEVEVASTFTRVSYRSFALKAKELGDAFRLVGAGFESMDGDEGESDIEPDKELHETSFRIQSDGKGGLVKMVMVNGVETPDDITGMPALLMEEYQKDLEMLMGLQENKGEHQSVSAYRSADGTISTYRRIVTVNEDGSLTEVSERIFLSEEEVMLLGLTIKNMDTNEVEPLADVSGARLLEGSEGRRIQVTLRLPDGNEDVRLYSASSLRLFLEHADSGRLGGLQIIGPDGPVTADEALAWLDGKPENREEESDGEEEAVGREADPSGGPVAARADIQPADSGGDTVPGSGRDMPPVPLAEKEPSDGPGIFRFSHAPKSKPAPAGRAAAVFSGGGLRIDRSSGGSIRMVQAPETPSNPAAIPLSKSYSIPDRAQAVSHPESSSGAVTSAERRMSRHAAVLPPRSVGASIPLSVPLRKEPVAPRVSGIGGSDSGHSTHFEARSLGIPASESLGSPERRPARSVVSAPERPPLPGLSRAMRLPVAASVERAADGPVTVATTREKEVASIQYAVESVTESVRETFASGSVHAEQAEREAAGAGHGQVEGEAQTEFHVEPGSESEAETGETYFLQSSPAASQEAVRRSVAPARAEEGPSVQEIFSSRSAERSSASAPARAASSSSSSASSSAVTSVAATAPAQAAPAPSVKTTVGQAQAVSQAPAAAPQVAPIARRQRQATQSATAEQALEASSETAIVTIQGLPRTLQPQAARLADQLVLQLSDMLGVTVRTPRFTVERNVQNATYTLAATAGGRTVRQVISES